MTTMEIDKPYLSVPEIAEMLGVGQAKVLGWIRTDQLTATDVSSNRNERPRWRISKSALESFLARRSTSRQPEPSKRRRKRLDKEIPEMY